jgi:hypothetical protein
MVDRLNPDRVEAPQKVSAQRMRLWHALHEFCRHNGGTVVSIPGHREMRIEVRKNSTLPVKLSELGYQPHHCCATSRINAGAFETVDVIAVMLPGK